MKKLLLPYSFLLLYLFFAKAVFAQINFLESFSNLSFPPEGWSSVSVVPGIGTWYRTTTNFRTAPGGAESDYSTFGGDNYLISKRFIPDNDDSLTFYLNQFYSTVYNDSLEIKISTTDSLVSSFTSRLLLLKDGINYPPTGTWGRFAIFLGGYSGQTVWIAFRHADLDGDAIRLDDIQVGRLPPNIVVPENVEPFDTISTDVGFSPKAKFRNAGSEHQLIPFSVTYKITGAYNYISTKTIDTLLVGQSKNVTFDSILNVTDTGICFATIYTSVSSDQDSINFTFHISPRNWGRSATGYYWANSENFGIPLEGNKPRFCWRDTTGSTSLYVNGQEVSGLYVGTSYNGDLRDGYFDLGNRLGVNSDNKCIRLNGINYTGFYPTIDGIIGLTNNNVPPVNIASNYPHFDGPAPALYVLWMSMIYKSHSFNRFSYKINTSTNELLITWDKVDYPYFFMNRKISFQACVELVDINDPNGQNSNIRFNYADTTFSRTHVDFLNAYSNFSYGSYPSSNNHLIGINPNLPNSTILYRYRFEDYWTRFRRSKTGPLFSAPNKSSLSVEFGMDPYNLNKFDCRIVNLRISLEGLQNNIIPRTRDTVKITLRNSIPPFSVVDIRKGFLDTLGGIHLELSNVSSQGSYYIVVEHRNSMRTWSATPTTFVGDTMRYDFTTAISQAYGNNMALVNGMASLFTGDVNQDGIVDGGDISDVDNALLNSPIGNYLTADLNWDGFVDASDASLVDNNAFRQISEISPEDGNK